MVQLTTVAALLVMLISMAEASTYRTTTEIREGNPSESKQCHRQMSSQQLRQCQEYLMYGQRGLLLLLKGRCNPQVLRQCCEQLGQVDEECRCDAIKKMLQQQQGELEREQMQGMVRRARNLPAMCGMVPHRCEIRGVWY